MTDVSVIIVNYNTLELTSQCVESIFEKTSGLNFEVIVVDNASSDGSRDFFSEDKRIIYIYNKDNVGFGRANNIGATKASGRYLFLLNSDTYLVNNAIYLIWNQMERLKAEGKDVACMGGMLYTNEMKIAHSYARFPSMGRTLWSYSFLPMLKKMHLPKGLAPISNYAYNSQKENCFEVDTITGADLMVDGDVINRCGLFDEEFFMYYEETEMQHRYMRSGYKRMIYKAPQIVHLEGKSNTTFSPKRTTVIVRSMFLYFKKTQSPACYFVYKMAFKLAYLASHVIAFPFTSGTCKEKTDQLLNIIKM